jgi:C-terminal processing protease CtpA/Prc
VATASEVRDHIQRLQERANGALRGLVVDLRWNGGGI